jgi:hypothetical protein
MRLPFERVSPRRLARRESHALESPATCASMRPRHQQCSSRPGTDDA